MTGKPLRVFKRLEVGPVQLGPRSLRAPYRLDYADRSEQTELIYRFEEDVFDPGDPASMNLASMMAVQVALNYGLFCKSMVFHGLFDEHDRRFIRDMAENTAREIYVKKFLEPNPFLTEEVSGIIPEKKQHYLAADLVFSDSGWPGAPPQWGLWPVSGERYAILSSGGKDSLLTFGLLEEMGKEAHPVFINESGRHWFTALNAYRHFQERIPFTARVWVNSDRVFAWMLRRMPFIRGDFSRIRSDEYPVRLWTVAVFIFGAIPLMKKRKVGRLLIGDEYDTTRRLYSSGIPHYDGLYDQSRYFDNVLSRYYIKKGWAINQFSLLRPLSELLIEKILVERYPALQELQVSCHAAHEKNGRVHPCGKCEKCRRIVAMLTALNADATRCGYTPSQIQNCLDDLKEKPVHQLGPDASHLKALLLSRGVLETSSPGRKSGQERPEVMHLRFDSERSPMNTIPGDLRESLYTIYLQHVEGAMIRTGRKWRPIDPLRGNSLNLPYPFDIPVRSAGKNRAASGDSSRGNSYLWGELTWPEAEACFNKVDIALLPVGSIEQHGPHLPLDTDAFDADYLARRIAEACTDPKPLVLPLLPYGVSYEHDRFKGTISISNDTLSHLVYEIGMSVAGNGIRKLVILNGHGGNEPALNFAAQMINRKARIFVCVDTGETSNVDIEKITETPNDVHAGEVETSTSLAVRPGLVRMDKASRFVPDFSSRYLNFTSKRGVSWYAYTEKISKNGVLGDPTRASAEKGEKIWQIMIAHLVALVEDLKNMTLDEIYQRRY
jgi:creatinine amidohydrolase/Fe(II)-dependent formamide hydrolase-like protein